MFDDSRAIDDDLWSILHENALECEEIDHVNILYHTTCVKQFHLAKLFVMNGASDRTIRFWMCSF